MIRDLVYAFISLTASFHDQALMFNDAFEASLSDKDLHFIVFGAAGALVFLGAWALFRALKNHPGIAAWLCSFFVMLMLALAVEVGQFVTGTGAMEIGDIAAGMLGFAAFSLVIGFVLGLFGALWRLVRGRR